MEVEEKPIEDQEQQPQPLEKNGREAFIEKYRGYHPDSPEELDDEDLWKYAGAGLGERDEYQGKYNSLNSANEKLAQVVGEYPEIAQFISMIANGESPLYAIGKSFGDMADKFDEQSLEEFRKGQEEYRTEVQKIKTNIDNYKTTLTNYAEKNGLSEEDVANINNTILDVAEALRTGDINEEVIDNVWKGMDYNSAVTANLDAAKLAGKNEAIEDIKSKKQAGGGMPDVNGKQGQNLPPKAPVSQNSGFDFVDLLDNSKKIN